MGVKFVRILATFAAAMTTACSFGGPDLQFIDSSTSEVTDSFGNYTLRVNCTVRNNGDAAQVTVSAQLDGLGGSWTESETSEIGPNEQYPFTVLFPEVEREPPGFSDFTYSCTTSVP